MGAADPPSGRLPPAGAAPVANPEGWVRALGGTGVGHDDAVARLHGMLLRVARSELHRRSGPLRISGSELDDLAHQAAADAVLAILGKLGQFRAESRFTTWACKFVIFEVSSKLGRHFLRQPALALDAEDGDRLPDRFGFDPARESEWRDLVRALHRAVEEEPTGHQRRVFVAIVLNGVPLDALAIRLGSTRNALYKTLFDARRKLRASPAKRSRNNYFP